MEANYLHIWPRHEFMVIALPNQDKSFTTTLFLPLSIFEKITTTDELLTFFQKYFPDAISFIGRENLIETYFSSKPLPLVSIKCSPHVSTYGDILLMGDAAHSMVPFYAQGMNSAFEDTLILFEKLKQNEFQLTKAFNEYK
jgi:kynurenine 3-monooxygenase